MINNRFNVVYHLLGLVKLLFYKLKIKNMEDINWNIIGDNKVRMKFTIPIKPRKKWWEFWKKDESKQAVKDLMSKFKEPVDFDGECFLPEKPKQ